MPRDQALRFNRDRRYAEQHPVPAARGRGRFGRPRGLRARGQRAPAVAAAAAPEPQRDDVSPERAVDDPHVRRKKRQVKASMFWQTEASTQCSLAFAVVTQPARRLLACIFAVERDAGIMATGGIAAQGLLDDERKLGVSLGARFSLCGRLVRDGGAVDVATSALEQALVSDATALSSPTLFKNSDSLSRNRGYGLVAYAAHWSRINGRMKRKNSFYGLVRAFESDAAEIEPRYQECCGSRPCCDDPWFLRRWKRKFFKNPDGTFNLVRMNWPKKAMQRASNAPMRCSIVKCEVLHGEMSNMVSKKYWWNIRPKPVIEDQVLKHLRSSVPLYHMSRALKSKRATGVRKLNQFSASRRTGKVALKTSKFARTAFAHLRTARVSRTSTCKRRFVFQVFVDEELAKLQSAQPDHAFGKGEYRAWKQQLSVEFQRLPPSHRKRLDDKAFNLVGTRVKTRPTGGRIQRAQVVNEQVVHNEARSHASM